jgi:hypothetical protein
MSVDVRTRTDGPRAAVDAATFFAALPDRLDEHHARMAAGLRWLAPRPLAIEVSDGVWSLSVHDDRVVV